MEAYATFKKRGCRVLQNMNRIREARRALSCDAFPQNEGWKADRGKKRFVAARPVPDFGGVPPEGGNCLTQSKASRADSKVYVFWIFLT